MTQNTPSTTCDAFNHTLKTFLQEIVECCGESSTTAKIAMFLDSFDTIVAKDPKMPMTMFTEALNPHTDLVMRQDPVLFKKATLPFGVTLDPIWAGADADTRGVMWQYIQMLFLLATTAQQVPPEVLQSVESLAKDYAQKVQAGELDMAEVTAKLMKGELPPGFDEKVLAGMDLSNIDLSNLDLSGLAGMLPPGMLGLTNAQIADQSHKKSSKKNKK